MKTIFACMGALVALPLVAQPSAAPAPATPRGVTVSPRGPGAANNSAVLAPGAGGSSFAAATPVLPATGSPVTNVPPGFPPPGTQVISPGVAISRLPGSALGGVLVTPNGVIPIPAQGLNAPHPRFNGAGSSLGSATGASPLGSAGAGSALGSTLGGGNALGSATGGPGLGGNVPPSAAGTSPGAVTGFGTATAGANVGGTAPSLAGTLTNQPAVIGLGASVIGSSLGAVNPVGNTFGGVTISTLNTNGFVGGIAGQGAQTNTNGLAAAGGIQVIEVPAPVYITPPEQFVPQPAGEELVPRTIVPPERRITPRRTPRALRQLPPSVTPPPPSPR